MADDGGISVIFINATDELITGIEIFARSDSITCTYLKLALLSQNWNNIPLNQALVL